ncbi:hypothetical protein FACS1894132_02450 [Clostridia bacterium]|nr:hypothetical protein FACS1894132_02450 [Clostridia bacterium]
MTVSQVEPLFILFSGTNDAIVYTPIIGNAIRELSEMLKEDADLEDERLPFVIAAIANFRYTQIVAAKDKIAFTPAGKINETHNGGQQFHFAKSLLDEYMKSIRSLLKDDLFSFVGIS